LVLSPASREKIYENAQPETSYRFATVFFGSAERRKYSTKIVVTRAIDCRLPMVAASLRARRRIEKASPSPVTGVPLKQG
jgi:hypothetical protein